jgi:hypothetical protein
VVAKVALAADEPIRASDSGRALDLPLTSSLTLFRLSLSLSPPSLDLLPYICGVFLKSPPHQAAAVVFTPTPTTRRHLCTGSSRRFPFCLKIRSRSTATLPTMNSLAPTPMPPHFHQQRLSPTRSSKSSGPSLYDSSLITA